MTTVLEPAVTPIHDALTLALHFDDFDPLIDVLARPELDRRDRMLSLLDIYDLHSAPLETLGDTVRHQHHPLVAALKSRCEADWLTELSEPTANGRTTTDAVSELRRLAARDRLPNFYKWLAQQATWPQVMQFLTLEGGPDGGFDDLVAVAQVGLSGPAKMEMAVNYWDEMGNGDPVAVHTTLHNDLVAAVGMKAVPRALQPTAALARSALGGLLTTNRALQPELIGALGLIELQAGPRCRLVLQAFDRLDAPKAAYPFYEVHADVDPRHGRDWLDNVVAPTVEAHPEYADRIVTGARWRSSVNAAFLVESEQLIRG